ncbi:MAG TPA: sigma-70 family RNA polymerase sigma factor, partial [Polyangiaceae bacterium]
MPRTPSRATPRKPRTPKAGSPATPRPPAAEARAQAEGEREETTGEDGEGDAEGAAGADAPEGDDALGDEAVEADAPEGEPAEEDADGPVPSERTLSESSSIERFDALQVYLREVQRHPLLTPEQTQALATKFVETQDPAIAAQLVTANLRLVVKIAYEYRRAYKNIMDLIQEGNIGLMQAVKRYDPYRGVKLSSYAAW